MAHPQRETWKSYAGREHGPDGYRFGDVVRHFWRKITGTNHPEGVDDGDLALLDLKAQRDQLCGHRRRFEAQLKRDEDAAQACVRQGKKQQAMLALRKKKQHQQLVLECQNHLDRVDELIENVETTRMQQQIVEALTAGVATVKKMQKEMGGVDYIQKLMDERQEALDAQHEISEALAGAGVAADDDEALAELARLEEAASLDALREEPAAGPPAAAPAAPAQAAAAASPAQPAAAEQPGEPAVPTAAALAPVPA
mmetsp:Transcript_105855/g.316154  ORF Transcript_105855/g.316154 Transcript_105855/m.316154 type:complete len:255 (-) Transcript_105855:58-822(-)